MVVSLVNCDDVCPGATGAHVRTGRECVGWAYSKGLSLRNREIETETLILVSISQR